jgi:AcrR family transcriptional regulator
MKKDKLESILETAKRMFVRYGLKKTSIDEVARAASVAKGTIYSYIGNKDMIYLAVLNREVDGIIEGILSAVARELSPMDKFAAFVKSKFRCMRQAAVILGLDRDGLEKL